MEVAEIDGIKYAIYETLAGYKVQVPYEAVMGVTRDKTTGKIDWIRLWYYWVGNQLVPADRGRAGRPDRGNFSQEIIRQNDIYAHLHFENPGAIPQDEGFYLNRAETARRRYAQLGSTPLGKGEAFPFPEYHLIAHTSLSSKKTNVYDWFELDGLKDPMGAAIEFGCGMKRERFINQDFGVGEYENGRPRHLSQCRAGYHLAPDARGFIEIKALHLKNSLQLFTVINAHFSHFLIEE